MGDHPIIARGKGGQYVCATCGYRVIHYRPTRQGNGYWKHASYRQSNFGEIAKRSR